MPHVPPHISLYRNAWRDGDVYGGESCELTEHEFCVSTGIITVKKKRRKNPTSYKLLFRQKYKGLMLKMQSVDQDYSTSVPYLYTIIIIIININIIISVPHFTHLKLGYNHRCVKVIPIKVLCKTYFVFSSLECITLISVL